MEELSSKVKSLQQQLEATQQESSTRSTAFTEQQKQLFKMEAVEGERIALIASLFQADKKLEGTLVPRTTQTSVCSPFVTSDQAKAVSCESSRRAENGQQGRARH